MDVVITEIGGTVGDIESLPFLEAIRQFPVEVGRRNCLFLHLTLVPYIGHAGELKTKPTQHSVNELRRIGIQPDMLMLRAASELPDDIRKKIALFCSVPFESVISAIDVDSIYKVPLEYHRQNVDQVILDHFGIEAGPPNLTEWEQLVSRIDGATDVVKIALVGKYVQLEDAYLSVAESLRHAAWANGARVEIDWVDSETITSREVAAQRLGDADGVLIPAALAAAGWRARSSPRSTPARSRCPTSASAWACRSRSRSLRATWPGWRARTPRSLILRRPSP